MTTAIGLQPRMRTSLLGRSAAVSRLKSASPLLSRAGHHMASLWPVDPGLVAAVVYTNPDYLPPLINEAWELDGANLQLHVVCRDYLVQWHVTYPDTTQLHRLACRMHNTAREYALFVLRVLAWPGRRPTVIVGHDANGFVAACLRSWLIRRPLIYRCHDFRGAEHAQSIGERFVAAFERRFARTADLVVVPDAERGEVIRRELRLTRPPLVVANAPRQSGWGHIRRQTRLNAELEKRGKRFSRVVLRQGTIGPGHAIEATIRSMRHWANCDWGFVLLGFSNSAYLAQLAALAESLGVADRLVVLPAVRYDDVAAYSAGADLGHALYEPTHVNN